MHKKSDEVGAGRLEMSVRGICDRKIIANDSDSPNFIRPMDAVESESDKKVYKMVVRPAIMYGLEMVVLTK